MSIEEHLPPPPPPPPGPLSINQTFISMEQHGGNGGPDKSKLMDDIRNGVKLKKCETIEKGLFTNGHQVNGAGKVC